MKTYTVYAQVRVDVEAENESEAIELAGREIEFGTDVVVEDYIEVEEEK